MRRPGREKWRSNRSKTSEGSLVRHPLSFEAERTSPQGRSPDLQIIASRLASHSMRGTVALVPKSSLLTVAGLYGICTRHSRNTHNPVHESGPGNSGREFRDSFVNQPAKIEGLIRVFLELILERLACHVMGKIIAKEIESLLSKASMMPGDVWRNDKVRRRPERMSRRKRFLSKYIQRCACQVSAQQGLHQRCFIDELPPRYVVEIRPAFSFAKPLDVHEVISTRHQRKTKHKMV